MSVYQHYVQHLGRHYAWMSGDFPLQQQQFEQFLSDHHLHPTASGVAIDLGAGHGIQAKSLARKGFQTTAIDFNGLILEELARNCAGLPVTGIQDDIRHVGRYQALEPELILCCGDTITHLDSTDEIFNLLRDCAGILRRQGKLLLTLRDHSVEPGGDSRFIPVRSDETRILTCLQEYFADRIRVTDLLYEKQGNDWQLKVSSYHKVRISPDWLLTCLRTLGLYPILHQTRHRTITLIALKK